MSLHDHDHRGLVRQNSLWDKIVLKKVRELLGGRVRMIFTGSAPIAAHVLDFLRAAFGCQVSCKYPLFTFFISLSLSSEGV